MIFFHDGVNNHCALFLSLKHSSSFSPASYLDREEHCPINLKLIVGRGSVILSRKHKKEAHYPRVPIFTVRIADTLCIGLC